MDQQDVDLMDLEGAPQLTAAKFEQLFGFQLVTQNEMMGPNAQPIMDAIVLQDFGNEAIRAQRCSCRVANGRKCINRVCPVRRKYLECPLGCRPGCQNNSFRMNRWKNKLRLVHRVGRGFGLIAKEIIRPHDMVLPYIGQVYLNSENPFLETSIYACDIDCTDAAAALEQVTEKLVIEPTVKGGWSRFFAHSCDPNTQMYTFCSDGKLFNALICIRLIGIDEEVTWNYGTDFKEMGIELCLCGAKNCKDKKKYRAFFEQHQAMIRNQPNPDICTPTTPRLPTIGTRSRARMSMRPSPRIPLYAPDPPPTPGFRSCIDPSSSLENGSPQAPQGINQRTPDGSPASPSQGPNIDTPKRQRQRPRTRLDFDDSHCAPAEVPLPCPLPNSHPIRSTPLVTSRQSQQSSPCSSPDCTPPPFCISPSEPTAIRAQPRTRIGHANSPCSPEQPPLVDQEGFTRSPRGPSSGNAGGFRNAAPLPPCSPQRPIRSSPVEPGRTCQPRQSKQPSSRLSPDITSLPPCSDPAQPPAVSRNKPKIRIRSRAAAPNMPISAAEIASLPNTNRPRTSPADEPCQGRPVTRPVTSPRQGEPMDYNDDGKQQQHQPIKKGKRKRESEGLTGNARRRQRQDIVNEGELHPEAVSSYEEVTTTRRVLRSAKTIEPQPEKLPKANPPKSKAVTKAKTASKPSAPPSTTTTESEETTSTTTRIRVRVIGNADPIIPSRIAPVIPKPKRGRPVENPGPFTCKIDKCGKEFDDFGRFNEHQQGVHGKGGKWECPNCDWTCNSERYLKRHLEQHKEEDERTWYECPTCENSKKYSRPAGVTKHQKSKKNNCLIQKAKKIEPKRVPTNEEDHVDEEDENENEEVEQDPDSDE